MEDLSTAQRNLERWTGVRHHSRDVLELKYEAADLRFRESFARLGLAEDPPGLTPLVLHRPFFGTRPVWRGPLCIPVLVHRNVLRDGTTCTSGPKTLLQWREVSHDRDVEVLLVGARPSGVEDAFAAAGHVVHHCHEPGDVGFACSALRGRGCPVEEQLVDVVVDVRSIPFDRPMPEEDGAICGARRRIPLVVTGDRRSQPFRPWTTAETELGDVVQAAESVAASPLPEHSSIATAAAVEVMEIVGVPADRTTVEVRRFEGKLKARIGVGDPVAPSVAQAATEAVARKLRKYDPWARGLDISVHSETA